MPNSNYRWVIVAAGGLVGCVAMGCIFALPIFLSPMVAETGWSHTGISAAMTIGFLAMAFAGLFWGSLSDRFGPRIVVLIGSVMLVGSLYLASLATSLLAFQLLFGLVAGVAVAAFFAPLMAAVTGWFDTQRGLAVSLVSAGVGVAPLTMTPLSAWLVTHYDWRFSMQILALIAAVILIPATFLLRRPPALMQQAVAAGVPAAVPLEEADRSTMTVKQALLSGPFIILALTNFFCCATHSGPIFHTVSYAIICGIPAVTAATIYSVEGLAGMLGRIGFGVVADKLGAKNVLVWGLLIQAFGALGYFFLEHAAGVLCGRGAVRLRLCRNHAALRCTGAREFPAPHDGHDHRRHVDGGQPRHGNGSGARRLALRHHGHLRRALPHLLRHGHRRLPRSDDVPAVPEDGCEGTGGVGGLVRTLRSPAAGRRYASCWSVRR